MGEGFSGLAGEARMEFQTARAYRDRHVTAALKGLVGGR